MAATQLPAAVVAGFISGTGVKLMSPMAMFWKRGAPAVLEKLKKTSVMMVEPKLMVAFPFPEPVTVSRGRVAGQHLIQSRSSESHRRTNVGDGGGNVRAIGGHAINPADDVAVRRDIDIEEREGDICRPGMCPGKTQVDGDIALRFEISRQVERVLRRNQPAGQWIGLRWALWLPVVRVERPDIGLLGGNRDGYIVNGVTVEIVGVDE